MWIPFLTTGTGLQLSTDTWSIKLTGGPDGDVAGNMLKAGAGLGTRGAHWQPTRSR